MNENNTYCINILLENKLNLLSQDINIKYYFFKYLQLGPDNSN